MHSINDLLKEFLESQEFNKNHLHHIQEEQSQKNFKMHLEILKIIRLFHVLIIFDKHIYFILIFIHIHIH